MTTTQQHKQTQAEFLEAGLREAAKLQPEIMDLSAILLKIGGWHLVPVRRYNQTTKSYEVCPDWSVPSLVEIGKEMIGPVKVRVRGVEPNRCHQNISRLWQAGKSKLVGIGTGYAMVGGLWREHTWGVLSKGLLDTGVSDKYFGLVLSGEGADSFATAMLRTQ